MAEGKGAAQAAINTYFTGNAGTAPKISYAPGAVAAGQADRIAAVKQKRLDDAAMAEALGMGLTNEQIMQFENEWQGEPGREHWVGSHFSGPEHSKPIYSSFADWWTDAKSLGQGNYGANNNVYGGKASNVSAENNAKGLGKPMGIWSLIQGLAPKADPKPVFDTPAPVYSGPGSSESTGAGTSWSDIKTSAARHAVESDFEQDGTGRQGWNIGGAVMDDDVWGADPLATPMEPVDLGAGRTVQHAQVPKSEPSGMQQLGAQVLSTGVTRGIDKGFDYIGWNRGGRVQIPKPYGRDNDYSLNDADPGELNYAKQILAGVDVASNDAVLDAVGIMRKYGLNPDDYTGYSAQHPRYKNVFTGRTIGENVSAYGNPIPRNTGGSVSKQKMSAGQWVGKRCRYLMDGGMVQPEAEMQAYNEMQSMTGPTPVGASFEMPQEAPMPEQYTPENNFGYVPSGGMTYKEQMEADKVMIQKGSALDKAEREERAFQAAERRKDEAHAKAMAQKDEQHSESMRQKKAGPLGPQGG